MADGNAQRRLLLALALVAAGPLFAPLTPIALDLVLASRSAVVERARQELPPQLTARGARVMTARFGQRRAPAPTRMAVAVARPAFE